MNNAKSTKITSIDNITNMSSNNVLDKALNYYGLDKKHYQTIATFINYTPKKIVKGKEINKLLTVGGKKYKELVLQKLVEKYKDETQVYAGNYLMSFKKYDNKTKQLIDVFKSITSIGTKESILENAFEKYEAYVEEYSHDYPENGSYEFNEIPTNELVPINDGSMVIGNQIIEGGQLKVETSVSGGQRSVGKRGVKRNMKMKDAFAFFKFGDDKQEWDTKQGKCVFDYLIWKYKDTKGFIKELRNGEEFLNNLFKDDMNINERNPLTQGVSIKQLEKFCDYFGVHMYAFDKTDNLIEKYESSKNKKCEALIFVTYDNHFYPVTDLSERKSKTRRVSSGIRITSNDIESFENKKNTKQKEIIAPTEEEFEEMKINKPDYLAIQNKWVLDYFEKNNGKLPFPIQSKNIFVTDSTIQSIVYDDKIIITKPIDKNIKRFYEDQDMVYQGENLITVVNDIWKNKYGFKFQASPFLSQSNVQVAEALNSDKVKYRTHIGRIQKYIDPEGIKEMLINENAIAVDITKCYCDAIYNQKESFIVFKGKEIVEEYDGKPLTLGLYFVETNDMTLLHQSNWYSKAIIELAIKEDIEINITRQIRCVDEEWKYEKIEYDKDGNVKKIVSLNNNNLFKDFCDEVIEITEQDGDYSLTKNVINTLTGFLGKTNTKTKTMGLSVNLEELWEDWLVPDIQENSNNQIFLNTIENDNNKFYLYGTEKLTKNMSNGLPMYIQLLDWSNIALYNLCKDVGGDVVYRKTDCIVSIGGIIPEDKLEDKSCSYSERFGKYHLEDIEKALLFNYELLMDSNRKVETPKLDNEWVNYNEFTTSDQWESIIKTSKEEGGMLISGRAGTGKSYIIEKGVENNLLPESNETRLAFTNRAAKNINGTTIHRVLALNSNNKSNTKTLESLKKYDTFIVDEISMINSELWNKLMILKSTTKATFILIGDYRQCKPIENGKETNYFDHPYVKRLVNSNRCELTTPQRYDKKLWDWLEKFYELGYGNLNVIKEKNITIENILNKKNICYTNKKRCYINEICMNYLSKTNKNVLIEKPKKCINEYADDAYIYVGLPVMSIAGNIEMNIYNTEELHVSNYSVEDETIELCRNEGDYKDECIEISFDLFHRYFVVNYASTTHKSQGMTINNDINIFEWFMMKDDKNVGYTAISRAKTCEQVTIVRKILF